MRRERALSAVPRSLLLLFGAVLVLQLWLAYQRPPPQARESALPAAPDTLTAQALSLGDPAWLSRALALWLQNFDFQPGISLPLAQLDYAAVGGWLDLQLALDPDNDYPLLAALHLYGSTSDKARVRWMLDWVRRTFAEAPATRWRYMAEASVKAKHALGDMALAREIADELNRGTRDIPMPGWARQMGIFLRADMGQLAEARALLGALIESGAVQRAEELHFLRRKFDDLSARIDEISTQ